MLALEIYNYVSLEHTAHGPHCTVVFLLNNRTILGNFKLDQDISKANKTNIWEFIKLDTELISINGNEIMRLRSTSLSELI